MKRDYKIRLTKEERDILLALLDWNKEDGDHFVNYSKWRMSSTTAAEKLTSAVNVPSQRAIKAKIEKAVRRQVAFSKGEQI